MFIFNKKVASVATTIHNHQIDPHSFERIKQYRMEVLFCSILWGMLYYHNSNSSELREALGAYDSIFTATVMACFYTGLFSISINIATKILKPMVDMFINKGIRRSEVAYAKGLSKSRKEFFRLSALDCKCFISSAFSKISIVFFLSSLLLSKDEAIIATGVFFLLYLVTKLKSKTGIKYSQSFFSFIVMILGTQVVISFCLFAIISFGYLMMRQFSYIQMP